MEMTTKIVKPGGNKMDMETRLMAKVAYWHAQVHRSPPLEDRAYTAAVDQWRRYSGTLSRFRARMAEVRAARDEPPHAWDMDDRVVY